MAHEKCTARIARLAACGNLLRRPEADYLTDGIFELRARRGHVQYRLLYCFYARRAAVLLHATTKESTLPTADVARARARKSDVEREPDAHLHEE